MSTQSSDNPTPKNYENNPFYIGLNGIKLLFTLAQSVAILATVLAVLGFLGQLIDNTTTLVNDINTTPEERAARSRESYNEFMNWLQSLDMNEWLVVGIAAGTAIFVFIVIGAMISGILDYSSSKIAKGQRTNLGEAAGAVWHRLPGYIWLQIVVGVKILLWALLFIIPGFIMAVRYSLSGTAFFAEDKKGLAAVKRSIELTKNGWLTTFAGSALWSMMTLGAIDLLVSPGVNGVLYHQFTQLEAHKQAKPPAHWLSWLTLIIPLSFFGIIIFFALLLVVVAGVTSGS